MPVRSHLYSTHKFIVFKHFFGRKMPVCVNNAVMIFPARDEFIMTAMKDAVLKCFFLNNLILKQIIQRLKISKEKYLDTKAQN